MLAVKYTATFFDHSGYASAGRSFICALAFAGVDCTAEAVAQTPEKAQYGWSENFIASLENRDIPYKIKFIHLTPDLYPSYMEQGKYHIGHLFWETDRLPESWVAPCNKMNEIWTASALQAEMIKNSGVTVPIKWFPQPIDTSKAGKTSHPYMIPNFEGLVFYAVFQWIERKNPRALIETYWKTFSGRDDVILALKTYGVTYQPNEFARIEEEIRSWKTALNLPHYPKIFFVQKLMDTDSVFRLHKTGDCFINASRGEGWNIPSVEAMLMGNPIISINKTGVCDYLPGDVYYPCRTKETDVVEQPSIPWYVRGMKWLDIDTKDLSKQMKSVYEDRILAKSKGHKAQEYVQTTFNYHRVGMQMRERLEEISKFL